MKNEGNEAYLKSKIYFFKIKYILKKYLYFSQRNKFNMVVQEDSRTSPDGSTTILILESVKNREDEEMILIQMLWREKIFAGNRASLSDMYFCANPMDYQIWVYVLTNLYISYQKWKVSICILNQKFVNSNFIY